MICAIKDNMSKSFDIASLTKKLKCVVNTQDSIPMFSLWIIHHKVQHKVITTQWLEVLKKSKPSHCLTLLYLCNDVIQNCKKKKAEIYKESFSDVLPEAIPFLRDKTILPNVQRVFKVWSKRAIFDVDFIDQLHAALLTNRAPDKLKTKLLIEYKPATLIDTMTTFKRIEDDILIKQKQIVGTRVDASNSEAIHGLKDKIGGEKFSQEFEESAVQLESFIVQYEKFIDKRKKLLELLDKGSVFYHAQYHEAKVVVDAYKSFGQRVSKMKRGLDKTKKKLPPRTTMPSFTSDGGDDMEMSDSDQELGSKPSKIVAITVDTPKTKEKKNLSTLAQDPVFKALASASNDSSPKKGAINRPGMRGASFVGSLPGGQGYKTLTETQGAETSPSKGIKEEPVPSPPGSESPPSPTGSPELNISSPPRLSLESRLADLFSEGANQGAASVTENSDSESDAERKVKSEAEQTPKREGFKDTDARNFDHKTKETTSDESPADKQVIPVIGATNPPTSTIETIQKVLLSLHQEGDSTPTQDEQYNTTQTTSSETSTLISPNTTAGDAINFLTNFLGTTVKTPEISTANIDASTECSQNGQIPVSTDSGSNWQVPSYTSNRSENSIEKEDENIGEIPPPFEELPPWLRESPLRDNSASDNANSTDDDPINIFNKAWKHDGSTTSNLITVTNQATTVTARRQSNTTLQDEDMRQNPPATANLNMDTDIRMHNKDIYNDNLNFGSDDQDMRKSVSAETKPDPNYTNRMDFLYEEAILREYDETKIKPQTVWHDPPKVNRFSGQPSHPRYHLPEVDPVDIALDEMHKQDMHFRHEAELARFNHRPQPRQRFQSPGRLFTPRGRERLRSAPSPVPSPYARPLNARPPYRPPHIQRGHDLRPRFAPRSYYG